MCELNAQEKQNKRFLSISHVANIGCHYVFFQDCRTLFICEGEEKPQAILIKFLHVWLTLKSFDVKEGLCE